MKIECKPTAQKAKIDAEKQKLADEAKQFAERQKAFEEEQAQWEKKLVAQEKGAETTEAATGPAAQEESQTEPAQEPAARVESEETQCDGRERKRLGTQSYRHNGGQQVTEPWSEDEDKDENTSGYYISKPDGSAEWVPSSTEKLITLIQEVTCIKKFSEHDLEDLMAIARGMYWDEKIDTQIRRLATLIREEMVTVIKKELARNGSATGEI